MPHCITKREEHVEMVVQRKKCSDGVFTECYERIKEEHSIQLTLRARKHSTGGIIKTARAKGMMCAPWAHKGRGSRTYKIPKQRKNLYNSWVQYGNSEPRGCMIDFYFTSDSLTSLEQTLIIYKMDISIYLMRIFESPNSWHNNISKMLAMIIIIFINEDNVLFEE